MGLRFRKSINLGGGFRINLSKSGIGYSWGTKGFRLTKTANGRTRRTYSLPGTGVSYVQENGIQPKNREQRTQTSQSLSFDRATESNQYREHEIYKGIDSNVDDVAACMKRTQRLNTWSTVLLFFAALTIVHPAFAVIPLLGVALKIYAHTGGRVHLNYSFDDEKEDEHRRRLSAWQILEEGEKEWQVLSRVENANTKRNAGATSTVSRKEIKIDNGLPYYIKANVSTVRLTLTDCTILILPDKVFVIKKKEISTFDYDSFGIHVSSVRYVESESVPKDATIVDYTWRYINKNGTPDMRFSNNQKLPVCLYGRVILRLPVGNNIELQISSLQNAKDFGELIR